MNNFVFQERWSDGTSGYIKDSRIVFDSLLWQVCNYLVKKTCANVLYSVVLFWQTGQTLLTSRSLSHTSSAYTDVSGRTTRLLKPLELMPWRKLCFASWLFELTMSLLLCYNSTGLMGSISYQKGDIWPPLWKYLGRNRAQKWLSGESFSGF